MDWSAVLTGGVGVAVVTGLFGVIIARINRIDCDMKSSRNDRVKENFLMMEKLGKTCDLSQLTAQKLHEAGIVNGDLEAINCACKKADEDYEKHIHQLAVEVLKR